MHKTPDVTSSTCRNAAHGRAGNRAAPRLKALPLSLSIALAAVGLLGGQAHAANAPAGISTGGGSITPLTSPTGGTVIGGIGSISQSGANTVINQLSNRLALDWQTFNVGKDATVRFNQPSSSAVALNRILDQNASQIFGKINANGRVFLINTHGIIFGSSAKVNVGSLVASTLDLTPTDFLANHYNLDAHGARAGVVNHGTIEAASGGSVSLVGGSVVNDGLILANYGNINLDGADRAVLDFDGNGLINIQVTGELKQRLDAKAAVANSGTLQAEGGTVVLQASAAKDLFTNLVNNSGVINAGGISTAGGVVRLVGTGGNVENSGTIKASGTRGGRIELLANKDVMVTGGTLDASGTTAGGAIRVGGGVQGGEGLTVADRSYVADGAVLNADATGNGHGGSIAVYSQNNTVVAGALQARGGLLGGDGGFIETSSHGGLNIVDAPQVGARAAGGLGGEWLIDPNDITIRNGGGSTNINNANPFVSTDDSASLGVNLIKTALSGGANVTVTTGTGGTNAQAGDITLATNLDFNGTGTNTLTFDAAHDILINNQIFDSTPGGDALNLNLLAGNDISLGANLSLGAGMAHLVAGGAISQTAGVITAATLTGSATGAASLTGSNKIGTLGNFSAAGLSLTNAQALTVAGIVDGGSSTSLTTTAGDLTLNGALSGVTTTLTSAGAISQGGAGVVNATTLTGSSAGSTTLDGANLIGTLGNFTAAGLSLTNAQTLTAAGIVNGGGSTSLQTTAGNLILNGALSGTATSLISAGAISQGGAGVVNATTLTGSSAGNTALGGANLVGTLGGFQAANFSLVDAQALTVSGPLTTTGGSGDIGLTVNTGALTLGTDLTGGVISLNAASALDLTNNVTATSLQLISGGDIGQSSGVLQVSGTTAISSGGAVTLINASNSFGGAMSLGGAGATNATLASGANAITLGSVDIGGALDVTSSGGITLGSTVTTAGAQSYHNAVTLGADSTLTSSGGAAIGFDSTVDGAHGLTVNTAGATTFGAAVGGTQSLSSLATDAGGSTVLNGNVTTSGAQTYGDAVLLAADTTLTSTGGGAIGLLSTVNGAHALVVNTTVATTFGGAVGGSTALTSLTTDAAGFTTLGGNVSTSGAQTYNDAVTLAGNSTLTSSGNGAISLVSTLDGAHTLVVNTGGALALSGAVGGSNAVTGLTTTSSTFSNGGMVKVNGPLSVTTSGGAITQGGGAFAVTGTSSFDAGSNAITLGSASNSFGGAVSLTGGTTLINSSVALTLGSLNIGSLTTISGGALDLGTGTVSGNLSANSTTSITVDGALTGLGDVAFSGSTPTGSGSMTGTGSITGLGATIFSLTGTKAGTSGGVGFSGFTAADAQQVSGATAFDDVSKSNQGMTFAAATNVAGTGAISNVAGSFADNTRTSSASGIVYSGFGSVSGTGGAVTGVTGTFDVGSQVSAASGIDYSGFNVATLSGNGSGATIAGFGLTYALDNAVADKGSSNGISWTSFGNINDATGTVNFGTGGIISGNVTAQALNYSSYGAPVTFDLSSGSAATTGIGGTWSGVTSVVGSSNSDTVTGNNQTYTLTSAGAGKSGSVNWSGFETIADSGTGTINTSGAQTFNLVGTDAGTVTTLLPGGFSGIGNLNDSTAGNFVFGDGAIITGTLNGGGAGTLDYSAYTTAVNVGLGGSATATGGWSGISTAKGGSASDTISGNNQTYTLTSASAGNNGSISWSGFEKIADGGTGTINTTGDQIYNLNGTNAGTITTVLAGGFTGIGNLSDSTAGKFVFADGAKVTGTVSGGGAGILDYSAYTTALNVGLGGSATGTAGWSGISTVKGGSASDTISGNNQTYTLTGTNVGSNGTVSWNSFENINDSNGTVNFGAAGSVAGDVTAQVLNYATYGAPVTFDLSNGSGATTGIGGVWTGVATVAGSGNSDTIKGNNQTYTLTSAGVGSSGSVNWSGFETIADGGTGTINTSGAQTFNLVGTDAGTVTTLLPGGFSGIGNLNDSTAGNFVFGDGAIITGTLNGGGAGTLDYSAYTTAVNVGLGGSATATGGWSGISTARGGSASDTISGNNQTYTLTSASAGNNGSISWSGFETIADGGTGTINTSGGQTFNLSGANAGTVTTLLPGGFTGIGSLSDDTAANVVFADGASLSGTVSGGGAGTLNYSAYTTPVNLSLAGTATGIGSWSGISTVNGGSGSDTISGSGQTYGLTGANAGGNGTLSWSSFENLYDLTGTVNFGTGGSVSGDITATTLSYGSYAGPVLFDLSDGSGATTGIGGTWSNVAMVAGSGNSDTITGNNQSYTLTGANAGNNGLVSWTSFENLQDSSVGTLTAANQTWSLSGHDQGSVTDLAGTFAGMGNLIDTGTGIFVMHAGADGDISGNLDAGTNGSLDYSGYSTPVAVNLAGTGSTGVAGTTSGVAVIKASSNLGVGGTATGTLDITNTGSGATTTLGALSVGSDLAITTSGAVAQTGAALTVNGSSTINAGTSAITLAGTSNDFIGQVTLTGGNTTITDQNALTLGTLSTGALSATSTGALNLGHGSIAGDLVATSNGGAITEAAGGLQVSGSSNLQAGGGAITLTDAGNHFAGAVTAAGQGVSLVDMGDLTVASLSSGTNGTVNLVAGGALMLPASGIDTGTADLVLVANGGAITTPGALSGGNITLAARDAILLNSDVTTAGTAMFTSSNGAITQSGGVLSAGLLTGSSNGNTALGGANLVTTLGSFSAANFSLSNAQALAVNGPLNVAGTLSLATTSGALSINGGLSANALDLTSATDLALTQNLSAATMSLNAGGGINQTAGVLTAGTLSGQSGGNTSLTAANKIDTLAAFNGGNITLVNDKSLLVTGPLSTTGGTGVIHLTTTTGAMTVNAGLTSATVSLDAATDLSLTGNLSATDLALLAGGAISQTGGVLTAGTLSGQSGGNTTLTGANKINALGLFSAANFDLTNAQALAVNGPLTVPGTLTLTTTTGALSVNTNLTANAIVLNSAADLALAHDINAATLSLASAGAISQSAGVLTAATLSGQSVGNTTLTGANMIGTLGAFSAANLNLSNAKALAVNGPLNVPGALTLTTTSGALSVNSNLSAGAIALISAADLTLAKDLTASAVSLTSGGTISQSAGVLTAGTLSGQSTGSTTLTGANMIDTLGAFSAANLNLSNARALAVNGPLNVPGALQLATTAGAMSINADLAANTIDLTSATDLLLAKNLSATSISLQSGGDITQSAGVLTTATLTGNSTGTTTLNGANLLDTLGAFSAANVSLTNAKALAVTGPLNVPGTLSLRTTSGGLGLNGNVTGGDVALVSAADLTQGGGVLQAATLSGNAAGSVALNQANRIDTLGTYSAVSGLSLTNAKALTINAAVTGGSSTRIATTSGKLTVAGAVAGGAIDLGGHDGLAIDAAVNAGAGNIVLSSAAGAISEGTAGSLTAVSLSGSSAGDTILDGANQVTSLGNFATGGNFSFRDLRTLLINQPLDINGGQGDITLTASGANSDLVLANDLKGRTVVLVAGRDLKQPLSIIEATTLGGSVGGTATLTGANRIGTLGDFSAGSLSLVNAQTLKLGGNVSVGTMDLTVAGDINQTGGSLTATSLTGSSTGSTALDAANHIGTVGAFTANDFSVTNAGALTVNGAVDGGSRARLTTTAGDLTIAGQVKGTATELKAGGNISETGGGLVVADVLTGQSVGATTLNGANNVGTLGAFSASGLSFTNSKNLAVTGPVAGGASTTLTTSAGDIGIQGTVSGTRVQLQSAGAITEGSAGVIAAGTLSGSAVGVTSLGTSALPLANQISVLGNFLSDAGFSLTNGQTLTLASVDGSAFTIDAGHSALYLGVSGGDLLQQGKTPLYDGAGAFSSTGIMGTSIAPIYVIGDSAQSIDLVGSPPAYFYALDRQGNILPLTGDLSFNVPTSLFFGKAQNGNGRGDAYIDPSVISANYRSFGIVPSGILLPKDQQQCQPELEDCMDE